MKFLWVLIAATGLFLSGCTPCNSSSDCREGEVCGAGHCQAAVACSAGQTNPCVCEGGAQGTQTCSETGSAFAACVCAADTTCGGAGCAVMPDLVGKSVAEAGQLLKELSLKLPDPSDTTGFIVERRVNDPPSQVLEQFPVAGATLAKHTAPVLRVVIPPDQETLGLPNSSFLVGALAQDDEDSAQAYYDAVDPGAVPTRGTLEDWKVANGFGSVVNNIPPEPADDVASAIYSNRADLGFGRHMHMRRKGNRLAFYVDNYLNLEDTVNNVHSFATVAMEWSPPAGDPSGRPFTKFFTFNKKGVRIYDPALDSHGIKLQPAVCLACHGGNVTDLTYANGGNLGAHFIPFDLDSLGFSTRPGYTRADQEAQFKKLNIAVKMTYPADDPEYPAGDPAPVPPLIDGWYGGPGMPSNTFDGTFVPPAWGTEQSAWDVYLGVFAKSCRGCHMQREPNRNFSTYDKFWGKQTLINQRVFEDGAMPLSEKGNLNFWLSSPSEPALLAQWLGKPLTGPGRPVPRVRVTNVGLIRPGDLVHLDGSESQYSQKLVWSQLSGPAVAVQTAGTSAAFVAPAIAADVVIQAEGHYGALTGAAAVTVKVVDPPSAPRSVTAAPGVRSATVQWTAPSSTGNSPLASYKVKSSVGGAAVVVVPATQTSALVTDLPDSAPVTFTVTAVNEAGLESASSAPSTSVSTAGVPGAPQTVSASPGNGQITVSWAPPASTGGSAITAYSVVVAGGSTTGATPANCVGAACSIAVTSLSNGTSYTVTVSATNAVGTGPASASASATPRTVPGAPTAVAAVRGDAKATVSWVAPASDGGASISGYVVTPSPAGGVQGTTTCDAQIPAHCSRTVTSLANGTPYTFTVAATNAAGTGAASVPTAAVTPATTPATPTLNAPTAGNGSATVSWNRPANNGDAILDYTINVYVEPGSSTCPSAGAPCFSSTPPVSVCSTALCTQLVGGLVNGTTYVFTVTARNGVGSGSASAFSSGVTPNTTPGAPSAPRSPSAVAGSSVAAKETADLSWTQPLDLGAGTAGTLSYTITESQTATQITSSCATLNCTATFTGLTGGLNYTFSITASTNAGTGPAAATNSILALGRPQPPTAVSAAAGDAQATVSWTRPANNGGSAVTSDTITTVQGGGSQGTVTCDAASPAHCSAPVTGLADASTYTFTVRANNAYGSSAASAASAGVTPFGVPTTPSGVSTPGRGNGFITVSWTSGSANGAPLGLSGSTIYIYSTSTGSCLSGLSFVKTASGGCTAATCSNVAVTGLTNGTSYCAAVTDTNARGEGAASSFAGPQVPATSPGAPNLSLVAGPATIQATYSVSSTGGLSTSLQVDLCLAAQSCSGAGSCSGGGTQASWASGSPHTFSATACAYSGGSAACTWNGGGATDGSTVVGRQYKVCAYASNAVGTGVNSALATPQVSYSGDNLTSLWTSCRSCHNSHTPNFPTVPNNSTEYTSITTGPYTGATQSIWNCPANGTSDGTIGCMGAQGWTTHGAEASVLQKWIFDGKHF